MKYVQSLGSLDVPPPYVFPGATVHAFVWETQTGPIQTYCDTVLNLGDDDEKRGFVYQPAAGWPYALLVFIDYPTMISTCEPPQGEPAYRDRGVFSQREVFVTIPVVRTGMTGRTRLLDTVLQWALPFIVVDMPMSAVCGREMVGLEKMLATIDIGKGALPGSFKGTVQLPGWVKPGDMQQDKLDFLDVETAPVLPTFRGSAPQTSLWTLFQNRPAGLMLGGLAVASELMNAAALGMLPMAMDTVSLRQFRDAEDPTQAAYQALVTCRSTYTNISDLQFYNENDVTIQFYETAGFDEILRVFMNLPDETTGRPLEVKAKAAFRFEADLAFENRRTVHTFAVDRPGFRPVKPWSELNSDWARSLKGFFGPSS